MKKGVIGFFFTKTWLPTLRGHTTASGAYNLRRFYTCWDFFSMVVSLWDIVISWVLGIFHYRTEKEK